MSTAAHEPKHIPALDGLRGLAVLLVLAVHSDRPGTLKPLLATGWIGVDLFFVLSGFLITRILLNSRDSPRYFTNFYARRILRIWPVYFAMLLFVFAGERVGILHDAATLGCWFSLVTFTQNLYVAQFGWSAIPDWLSPTWSLGIEEQFYVLWPFLVKRLRLITLQRFCLAVVIVSPLARAFIGTHTTNEDVPMLLTFCRLDGLCLGTWLALALDAKNAALPRRLKRLALPSFLAFLIVNHFGGQFWIDLAGYSLLALTSAGVIAICVSGDRGVITQIVGKCLSWAPLRFFGRVSYCLYLVHTAAFAIVGSHPAQRWLRYVPGYQSSEWWLVVAQWAFTIALSTLSWRFYEAPILRVKSRFSDGIEPVKTLAAGQI